MDDCNSVSRRFSRKNVSLPHAPQHFTDHFSPVQFGGCELSFMSYYDGKDGSSDL